MIGLSGYSRFMLLQVINRFSAARTGVLLLINVTTHVTAIAWHKL